MRSITACTVLAALLTMATAAGAEEKKCTLVKATSVQMIRSPGDDRELVPVTVAGTKKYFLFSTAGAKTQIGKPAADELKLASVAGMRGLNGISGQRSIDGARIPEFDIGGLGRANLIFPITPSIGSDGDTLYDGELAPDYLSFYDVDVDFGSDTLNLFLPDHCPGGVVYWSAPAVAILPIIKTQSNHMAVAVTLDGQKFEAIIDTAAPETMLRQDHAEQMFGLSLGSAETPITGALSAEKSLPVYRHAFKTMTLGDITVNNPKVALYPATIFGNDPDMILGMDVLRKLHIYFAQREGKMYISPASVQTPEQKALQVSLQPTAVVRNIYKLRMTARIAALDKTLVSNPNDYKALNDRCFFKATIKNDLDAALADCNQSVRLKPDDPLDLDSRAFVLYQQGKYQEAVSAYDAALAVNPRLAESLFMRGHAKGKLGDAAGMAADIAAAKTIKPDIENEFQPYDVDL